MELMASGIAKLIKGKDSQGDQLAVQPGECARTVRTIAFSVGSQVTAKQIAAGNSATGAGGGGKGCILSIALAARSVHGVNNGACEADCHTRRPAGNDVHGTYARSSPVAAFPIRYAPT